MTRCDVCGAETSNGLALCQACQGMLVMLLEYVPIYFRNLSRWRPSSLASDRRSTKSKGLVHEMVAVLDTGRISGRPSGLNVSSSADLIGTLLDESHADLTGWLRLLADDRPQLELVVARIMTFEPERAVRLSCALLVRRVATLTTLPWVRDLVTGVRDMEHRLRIETERAVPGWYAGSCRRCDVATYVVPGLTWVTCQGCGSTTAARDHLEIVLEEARGWVARPKRIAEVIVALVDTEQSVPRLFERIVKWGARRKIAAIRDTARDLIVDDRGDIVLAEVEVGRARYRFGEVFDQLMTEGATRASRRERMRA